MRYETEHEGKERVVFIVPRGKEVPDEFDVQRALERHKQYIDGVLRGVPCDWQYERLIRLIGW